MRTYGLLNNIAVAALVLILSLVPLGANLVRIPSASRLLMYPIVCPVDSDP